MTKPGRRPSARPRLTAEDWIAAARKALIDGGISTVKIEAIARTMRVTPGSFYWHFADRSTLLDALLEDWADHSGDALNAAVRTAGLTPQEKIGALMDVWIAEEQYDPAYDAAVRDWARTSDAVENAVHAEDDRRIALLVEVYELAGFEGDEAFVRARIAYFHQVGYYAMRIRETADERRALKPIYLQALLPD